MANRSFKNPLGYLRDTRILAGSFAPNGSSAVSNASNYGLGFSVARAGAGDFTVTISDTYASGMLISAHASLQLATNANLKVQVGAIDLAAKTVQIIVNTTGAVATDVSADANNRVNFCLVFKNSTALAY